MFLDALGCGLGIPTIWFAASVICNLPPITRSLTLLRASNHWLSIALLHHASPSERNHGAAHKRLRYFKPPFPHNHWLCLGLCPLPTLVTLRATWLLPALLYTKCNFLSIRSISSLDSADVNRIEHSLSTNSRPGATQQSLYLISNAIAMFVIHLVQYLAPSLSLSRQ